MSNRPSANNRKLQAMQLIQAGRHADAVTLLQSVCASAPRNAEARYLLGCSHARLGQLEEAREALQQSIRIRPDVARTHTAMGRVLRELGRLEDAVSSYEAALDIDDTFIGAHIALAETAMLQTNYVTAENHLKAALALDPAMSHTHMMLGRLEMERGNELRALAHFKKALQHDPRSVETLCSMALTLRNLSREDEVEACYAKALEIEPDSPEALTGLALFYDYSGQHERAIKLVTPLLEKKIRHAGVAQVFAQLCKHVDGCQEAVALIDDALELPHLPISTKRALHFSAGKLLDRLERYDEAFDRYRAGNDLATTLYNAVGNAQYVNDLIDTFTPALFMRLPRSSLDSSRLVFIVGMPRSGTSLTEQILASHPQVFGGGELLTITNIIQQFQHVLGCAKHFPACIEKLQQEHVDKMATQYIDHITRISGPAEFVTDKFPHNFYALGLIQLLFPNAKIIHCRRDPLDTGLSIYFQDFLDEHDYAKDLFNIGIHYHQYQRLMQHWRQVLSLPMLEIDYEEMVSNQEGVTSRLLAFCGLEWDDACLRFHELDRQASTASYEQVRQPIYTKSVGRWKHYEQYLGPLREGLERGH